MRGDEELREEIVRIGRRLFDAGLAPGSSGNVSVRHGNTVLVTPTHSRLGALRADELSLLGIDGLHQGGLPASKEAGLHLEVYGVRPDVAAIVHLHSPYSVAASCLSDLHGDDALPPFTAYALMRLGAVGIVPFAPPGSAQLADAVSSAIASHSALLLANHGCLVAAATSEAACADAEELEQAAQTHLLLRGLRAEPVPARYHDQLRARSRQA